MRSLLLGTAGLGAGVMSGQLSLSHGPMFRLQERMKKPRLVSIVEVGLCLTIRRGKFTNIVKSFRYQVARTNGKCHLQMLVGGYANYLFLPLLCRPDSLST